MLFPATLICCLKLLTLEILLTFTDTRELVSRTLHKKNHKLATGITFTKTLFLRYPSVTSPTSRPQRRPHRHIVMYTRSNIRHEYLYNGKLTFNPPSQAATSVIYYPAENIPL